ncbi:MAG: tetratricopeptide repeat protein [Elusimicrobia bacterium]|nr:tetratricopeptide repeat protein [Elusimicrobiota bacterium]
MRTLILLGVWAAASAWGQERLAPTRDADGLFLDMAKLNLGTITSEEDKKKYIYTIQLEKARMMRKTLNGVYENAFDLYRKGDFSGARELTGKILAVDPAYEDASILQRATIELSGSAKPYASSQKLVEDRFEEGMALYRQGRLVEAAGRWEEAVKLSPANLKARWWLRKVRNELAEDHFRRGQKAYRQHRLRECLDQWYAALVLNPRYSRLAASIAKVEAEAREADANERLQTALNLYSQGLIDESIKMLDEVLALGPGNVKAQKLQAEIRAEMASQHVAAGRKAYETRRYDEAQAEWKKAVTYGYDTRAADQLIARAKEQVRREEAAKRRAAEVAKQKAEEEKRKVEEEARLAAEEKKKQEEAAKAAAVSGPTTTPKTDASVTAAAAGVSEENKRQSQQYYLSGIIYYDKGDFEKARNEWTHSLQLDPSNPDAKAGLERINSLYGSGGGVP